MTIITTLQLNEYIRVCTVRADVLQRAGFQPAPKPPGGRAGIYWKIEDVPRIIDWLVDNLIKVRNEH